MQMDEYQAKSQSTAIYPPQFAVIYPAMGLAGEVGETLNNLKKVIRDGDADFSKMPRAKIIGEIGDCLWYLTQLCTDLGLDLGFVAQANLEKLKARSQKGNLGGNGDER